MKLRILGTVVAASAIVTMPALSLAADTTAVDNCTKAFVASLSTKFATAPKVIDKQYVDNGPTAVNSYEWTMTATDPRDHKAVARAVCRVGVDGVVLSLTDETDTEGRFSL